MLFSHLEHTYIHLLCISQWSKVFKLIHLVEVGTYCLKGILNIFLTEAAPNVPLPAVNSAEEISNYVDFCLLMQMCIVKPQAPV